MGKTLRELQEENARLKAIRDIEAENKTLKKGKKRMRKAYRKQNYLLRNPKKVKFVKKVAVGAKRASIGMAKGVGAVAEQYAKAQASQTKRPASKKRKSTGGFGLGINPNFFG